jgi:hypothetical protein
VIAKKYLLSLSVLFCLAAISCFSPFDSGGRGTIEILLPGAGARSAAADAGTLHYDFTLSGPGGETLEKTIAPGDPMYLSIAANPGAWEIKTKAYTGDTPPILRGTGNASVTVEAGETARAHIEMKPSLVWYVSGGWDGSDDANSGRDATSPLATVTKALTLIQEKYDGEDWPGVNEEAPDTATIVISGEITSAITIEGNLPPLEFRGKSSSYDEEGILPNITIINANKVTMEANIAKAGTVMVSDASTFIMNGGSISYNNNTTSGSAGGGGGVRAWGIGTTFIMNGGIIRNNSVNAQSSGNNYGGGVFALNGSTFTMNGGMILNNSTSPFSGHGGAGVTVMSSTFTMKGGKIAGNTANGGMGGGVYLTGTTTMDMYDGEISGNRGNSGVYINGSTCNFNMYGGSISNHSTTVGVYVTNSGKFTMHGGEISGNTVKSASGGGVCVNSGTFKKIPEAPSVTSGIIYGYTEGDPKSNKVVNDSNVVQNNRGAAVYTTSGKRESTAGPEVQLDSTQTGAAGGWE